MCGISGFNWNDKELIKRMIRVQNHRGPDDNGYYNDKYITLGNNRLAIIDLSKAGHQPISNYNNDIWIVFNGEIYNFKEIRKELELKGYKFRSNTDTEVIVNAYEEYGDSFVERLDGMFAFAIYDSRKRRLFIARDRMGKKPLYYYYENNKIVFASEIKTILEYEEIEKKIDRDALAEYLVLRYIPAPRTILTKIKKLCAGEYLIYDWKNLTIKKYYNLPKFTSENEPNPAKLLGLMEDAVEKRLIADVPIGVFLSGGLDSSAIVALMGKFSDKVRTYSVGFNRPDDELEYAKIVAEKFNTEHKEIIVDFDALKILPKVVYHFDEPLYDPAAMPTYLMARETVKNVKVVLAGEGGDEVFLGYPKLKFIKYLNLLNRTYVKPVNALLSKAVEFSSYFFAKGDKRKTLQAISEIISKTKDARVAFEDFNFIAFNTKDYRDIFDVNHKFIIEEVMKRNDTLLNNAIYFDFKVWLPDDLLMKVDKMSMANSLEVRAPYLDKELIKYNLGIDNKFKIGRKLFKQALKSILPKEILNRKKQGFRVPIDYWLSNDNLGGIQNLLENLMSRKYFNNDAIKKLLENKDRYRNNHKIMALANLESWHQIYLDGKDFRTIRL